MKLSFSVSASNVLEMFMHVILVHFDLTIVIDWKIYLPLIIDIQIGNNQLV